jgi:proline dehydrogenase
MFHVPGADELLRGSLLHMSDSRALAHWLTHNPLGRKLASRFVAGETLDSAIAAVRQLNAGGIRASLDHLGEAVTNPAEAIDAATEYVRILGRLHGSGATDGGQLGCNVSLKLTQMGLDISLTLCMDNLLRILDKAEEVGQFVRLDMESSHHTEATLRVFEDAWGRGHRNCGIVLQAYLLRSERDVDRAIELGCRVRLCKGAYAEPPAVAFADKHDTDANYLKLARKLLDGGHFPGLATHDLRIIREIESWQPEPSSFEFQMLYGVRPELQRRLVEDGWGMRAYVPFGSDWYAYFMRRLAERPANLMFFLTQLKDYLPLVGHTDGTAER